MCDHVGSRTPSSDEYVADEKLTNWFAEIDEEWIALFNCAVKFYQNVSIFVLLIALF